LLTAGPSSVVAGLPFLQITNFSLPGYFAPPMSVQLDDFPPTLDRTLRHSVIVLWFSLNDPTVRRITCPCRGRRSSDITGRTDGWTDGRT